jgi:hypothetical protein
VDHDNVIPFRKRPPSEQELEVYRQITRNWDPALRQMMFPDHFKREQQSDESSR